MQLIDKANILSELWVEMREHEPWFAFFLKHEDSLFLSYGISNGFVVDVSTEAEQNILSCYENLCSLMEISDSIEFSRLNDLFEYSVLNRKQV